MIRIFAVNNYQCHYDGFAFEVEGRWIRRELDGTIKAVEGGLIPPSAASVWCDINSLRKFWNDYRLLILDSLNRPVVQFYGELIPSRCQSL